ncbi:MAG: tetraacyldisaccharide 4'-kinase [Isosphaeraceae bacterium]
MSANREDSFLRVVRGETRGLAASAARRGLSVASAVYGVAVSARNMSFDRGLRPIHRVGAPVVSVGNLTLGGTGKTPMVEWVARWYRHQGVRVAILSRGYQRQSAVNDEALVLEENLPDVPHLQDPDRVKIARIAIEELESELLILDDGFQHRRLARDLDLVLLDALDPFGLGRVFPRGLLREPLGGLRRASLVIVTRADLVAPAALAEIRSTAERAVKRPLAWATSRHAPIELVGGSAGPEALDALKGRNVAAFCGIGNPEGFRRTIEPLVGRLAGIRTFPDHHHYQADDVAELIRWARDLGAELVLTTQKDLVKLRVEALGAVPLRALRIGLEILSGEVDLVEALTSATRAPGRPL